MDTVEVAFDGFDQFSFRGIKQPHQLKSQVNELSEFFKPRPSAPTTNAPVPTKVAVLPVEFSDGTTL